MKNTFILATGAFALGFVGLSVAESKEANRVGLLERYDVRAEKVTKSIQEDKNFLKRWQEVQGIEPAAGAENNYGYSDNAINHFRKALKKFK